jgi:hypothetical protein
LKHDLIKLMGTAYWPQVRVPDLGTKNSGRCPSVGLLLTTLCEESLE